MIRDIILACGCKVELTILPPASLELFDDTPIQGVLMYPCKLHAGVPRIGIPAARILIQGLN